MGPAIFDRALSGDLPLERAVDLLCERPARLFGLYPRKGALLPGCDADFLLFDTTATWTVDRTRFFTKSRDAARLFDGRTLRGRIVHTVVRGETVYENGTIAAEPGRGRFVTPLAPV